MKKLFILLLSVISINFYAQDIWHKGYYRNDGTYVKGHWQTSPNNTVWDNYSTIGNYNPYTGQQGYVNPYGSNYYNNTVTGIMGSSNIYGTGYSGNIIGSHYTYPTSDGGTMSYNYGSEIGSYTIYTPPAAIYPINNSVNDNSGTNFIDDIINMAQSSNNSEYKKQREVRRLAGKQYAKDNFKVKKRVLWIPAIASSIFFPLGIGGKIWMDVQETNNKMVMDKWFKIGYKKEVRKRVFRKSALGLAIGTTINVIAIILLLRH